MFSFLMVCRTMLKFVTVLFFFFLATEDVLSQEQYMFNYVNIPSVDSPVNEDYVRKNVLGESISLRLALLREIYTWVEEGDSMSPGEKINVEKPSIYYAVRKLSGYYKKAIKKDEVKLSDASEEYLMVLEKSIALRKQDTSDLEEELSALNDPKEVIDLFKNRVLLE